jgi:hypothetical protein
MTRRSPSKSPGATSVVRSDNLMLMSIRIKFVAGLVAVSAIILAITVFVVAFFSHGKGLVTAGLIVLAVGVASNAVPEGARIWLGLYVGRWIGPNQKPIWREEQPARFWSHTAIHAILAAVYLAGALCLIWFGPSWTRRL